MKAFIFSFFSVLLLTTLFYIPYSQAELGVASIDGGGYIIISTDVPWYDRLFQTGALVAPVVTTDKSFTVTNEFYGGATQTPLQAEVRIFNCPNQLLPDANNNCPKTIVDCGAGGTLAKAVTTQLSQANIDKLKSGSLFVISSTVSMPKVGCYWLSGAITSTGGGIYAVEKYPKGFAVIQGTIIGCPDNYCDSVTYTDIEGGEKQKTCCYSYTGSSCTKVSTCPESIVCDAGYKLQNGACVKIQTCPTSCTNGCNADFTCKSTTDTGTGTGTGTSGCLKENEPFYADGTISIKDNGAATDAINYMGDIRAEDLVLISDLGNAFFETKYKMSKTVCCANLTANYVTTKVASYEKNNEFFITYINHVKTANLAGLWKDFISIFKGAGTVKIDLEYKEYQCGVGGATTLNLCNIQFINDLPKFIGQPPKCETGWMLAVGGLIGIALLVSLTKR